MGCNLESSNDGQQTTFATGLLPGSRLMEATRFWTIVGNSEILSPLTSVGVAFYASRSRCFCTVQLRCNRVPTLRRVSRRTRPESADSKCIADQTSRTSSKMGWMNGDSSAACCQVLPLTSTVEHAFKPSFRDECQQRRVRYLDPASIRSVSKMLLPL